MFNQKNVLVAAAVFLTFQIFLSMNPSSLSFSKKVRHQSEYQFETDYDILVMVMGPEKVFRSWYDRLVEIQDVKIDFIYAAFDEDFEEHNYHQCQVGAIRCSLIYVANTTWTEGRNLMIKEAIALEKRRKKEYDFWLLSDEDAILNCHEGEDLIHGPGSCWQKLFTFIGSEHVKSDKVSSVSVEWSTPGKKLDPRFSSTSYTDAMIAGFKRSAVPYLLPYPILEEGYSQWTSQAALYCLMDNCFKQSTLLVPLITGDSAIHRDYVRGMFINQTMSTIRNNYDNDKYDFHPCKEEVTRNQIGDRIFGSSAKVLLDMIPEPALEYCNPLKERFSDFAKDAN